MSSDSSGGLRSRVGLQLGQRVGPKLLQGSGSLGVALLCLEHQGLFLSRRCSTGLCTGGRCGRSSGLRGSGVDGRALARVFEVHICRRHTVLVVAGTIGQISVDGVSGLGELDLLHELHAILEVAQLHIEEFVERGDLVTDRFQLTDELHAVEFVDIKGGGDRTVSTESSGIDVPSALDSSGEHNLSLGRSVRFQLRRELHGVEHLCVGQQGKDQQQGQCHCFFHL